MGAVDSGQPQPENGREVADQPDAGRLLLYLDPAKSLGSLVSGDALNSVAEAGGQGSGQTVLSPVDLRNWKDENDEGFQTPVFLTADNLKPFISKEVEGNSNPIVCRANGKAVMRYSCVEARLWRIPVSIGSALNPAGVIRRGLQCGLRYFSASPRSQAAHGARID